ncbi:FAD-binding domain-containing protein [Xylaria intraflava]|nr:FAD-binding domain-containing protein [Xylaria intraflava]
MLYCLVTAFLAFASLALSNAPTAAVPGLALHGGDVASVKVGCDGTDDDVQCVCQELHQALPNENGTLFPSDGAIYNEFEDENYSAACRLAAACIVNPSNSQEVADVIQILAKHDTKFAVRSGGHNYNPGFASINESGVLVSLSQLDSIALSDDLKSINVGTGSRWRAVYEALVPKWLTAVGGRVGPVGVGGLISGGGLSYFSTDHGLSLDNVKSFEVVLANGSIVNASMSNDYADLYKALRGGSNNFGIVTLYELYTHPMSDLTIDARAYYPNQTTDFLKALAEYQKNGQVPRSSVSIQILETGPTLLMLYTGEVTQPDAFAPFYALEPYVAIRTPGTGTLLDALNLSDSRFTNDTKMRVYGETFSHISDADLLNDLYSIFAEETANLPVNVTATWVPNPISSNVATIGKQNGGNLLNLSEVAQVWYESFITYDDPAHDDLVRDVTGRVTQKCIAAAKEKKLDLPYLFAGVASKEQEVLQGYGDESIAFMQTVAAKYDPEGVFQRLQNDGFLLRDV